MQVKGYKVSSLAAFFLLSADTVWLLSLRHFYIYEWVQLLPITLICAAVAAVFASPKHGKFVVAVGINISLIAFIAVGIDFSVYTSAGADGIISMLSLVAMYCLLGISLVLKGIGRHLPHSAITIICLTVIYAIMYILIPSRFNYYLNYNYFFYEILLLVTFVLMLFSIDRMPACINRRKGAIDHTIFCEKCGSANEPGSKFCTACGAKLAEGDGGTT